MKIQISKMVENQLLEQQPDIKNYVKDEMVKSIANEIGANSLYDISEFDMRLEEYEIPIDQTKITMNLVAFKQTVFDEIIGKLRIILSLQKDDFASDAINDLYDLLTKK